MSPVAIPRHIFRTTEVSQHPDPNETVKVVPLTHNRANEVIAQWHRHNKPVVGCRFAIGAEHGGELVGVAVVGRPVARMVDFQKVAEVTRLCVMDGAPKNTCSFLYAACRRIWAAMGGERIITYTLTSESGASLRGAGWTSTPVKKKGKKGWLSRDREHQAVFDEEKLRWEAPNWDDGGDPGVHDKDFSETE